MSKRARADEWALYSQLLSEKATELREEGNRPLTVSIALNEAADVAWKVARAILVNEVPRKHSAILERPKAT